MKTRVALWLARNLSSGADERRASQRQVRDEELGRVVFDGGSRLRGLKQLLGLGLAFSAGVAFAEQELVLVGVLVGVLLVLCALNSKLEEYARKVL